MLSDLVAASFVFQVASDGLKAKDIVLGAQIDLRLTQGEKKLLECDLFLSHLTEQLIYSNNNMENCGPGYGTDINVPVYATVKGVGSSLAYSSSIS